LLQHAWLPPLAIISAYHAMLSITLLSRSRSIVQNHSLVNLCIFYTSVIYRPRRRTVSALDVRKPQRLESAFRTLLFLTCDAMRKRGLCCRPVSVSLSVRLSRWWIVSKRLKISSNFFLGPSLLTPSAGTQFQREPLQREHKIQRGRENFCDFLMKLPSISETVRDRPVVAMER